MPRVIVSSGHTSREPGTQHDGLSEYDVARKIAKATLPILRQNGIITLSVPPDLDLENRVEWINNTGYTESANDLAVEIHINEGGKSGIETWFEAKGANSSQKLSDLLLESVSKETGLPKQGSKSEYDHEFGSIAFLHDVSAVTTLVECGYIDNEPDSKLLKDESGIKKFAIGITKGILAYFGIEYKEATASTTTSSNSIPANQPTTISPPDTTSDQNPANPITSNVTVPSATDQIPPIPVANFPSAAPTPIQFPSTPTMRTYPSAGVPQFPSFPGNQPMGFSGPEAGMPPAKGFMTREERKKMIEENYVKILGREPNQNDLNYFLNTGISEQDLIKKMVDSQEHADLVKARQEVIKAKEELNGSKTELLQLRASTEDQKVIIQNLHSLISQKNSNIAELQQQLSMSQTQQAVALSAQASQENQPTTKYKGTFMDRLFKAFSDLFE